jgi:hypothetical protein
MSEEIEAGMHPDARLFLLSCSLKHMVLQLDGPVTNEGEPFSPEEISGQTALLPILLLEADRIARDCGVGPLGVAAESSWQGLCGMVVKEAPKSPISLVLLMMHQAIASERDEYQARISQIKTLFPDKTFSPPKGYPVDALCRRWMEAFGTVEQRRSANS